MIFSKIFLYWKIRFKVYLFEIFALEKILLNIIRQEECYNEINERIGQQKDREPLA